MSGSRIGSAATLAALIVILYALWPKQVPVSTADPIVGREQMQAVYNERQNANTAALLGSSAIPAVYDTGEPPPWASLVPQMSAQTR